MVIYRFIAGYILLLGLFGVQMMDSPSAEAAARQSTNTIDRTLAPVIVTDVFPGASIDEIFVYRFVSDEWEQIPFQIDEVTDAGAYTANEDGILDANDEIVFMASDLGAMATTAPIETLTVQAWYQIEVTDPLQPDNKGYAYVLLSDSLTVNSSTDYVDHDEEMQHTIARDYTIGWASDHNGLDYISLFGNEDILDRTKLRIVAGPLTITEDDAPVIPLETIRDGRVRVISIRGQSTTIAYAALIQTTTSFNIDIPFEIPANAKARLSTDLVSGTTGSYYDENTAAPIAIDGVFEQVASAPFNESWRQISLASGTMIQVAGFSGVSGTPRHYYNDDSSFDDGTGENGVWGDSGFELLNFQLEGDHFTYTSDQYILPGAQENRGSEFYKQNESPLGVQTILEFSNRSFLFLPAILTNEP